MEALLLLPSLRALSLPNTVHADRHVNAAYELNQVLRPLRALQRLNLASCNLRDCVEQLLHNLDQDLSYLSLRDCRLSEMDIQALIQVRYPWGYFKQSINLIVHHNKFKRTETESYVWNVSCMEISINNYTIKTTRNKI